MGGARRGRRRERRAAGHDAVARTPHAGRRVHRRARNDVARVRPPSFDRRSVVVVAIRAAACGWRQRTPLDRRRRTSRGVGPSGRARSDRLAVAPRVPARERAAPSSGVPTDTPHAWSDAWIQVSLAPDAAPWPWPRWSNAPAGDDGWLLLCAPDSVAAPLPVTRFVRAGGAVASTANGVETLWPGAGAWAARPRFAAPRGALGSFARPPGDPAHRCAGRPGPAARGPGRASFRRPRSR